MFAGYVGFSQIFESPKEKALKREVVNLKLNYGLISKKMNQVEVRFSTSSATRQCYLPHLF